MVPLNSKLANSQTDNFKNINSGIFQSEYTTPQAPQYQSYLSTNYNIPQIQQSPNFDSLLDKLMNYRNGIFFLEELAETLTSNYIQETRFLIFYLLNKAMKLLQQLRQGINSQDCPRQIVGNELQWNVFQTSDQCQKLKLYIENDFVALNQLFEQYLEKIEIFIDKNYQKNASAIKQIVNRNLTVDLTSLGNQEFLCKQQEFVQKARSENEPNLFVIAYNLSLIHI
eukprot:TRINITY_DN1501_c0_g1_i2.p1 TRINITY_DN1501_c0_g1~~TRINITY_DN1501_c0_g1_i2.p1  ORF type:complete len:226 (-),score=32.13 TRINITY_DN1501_c0_g1_i2:116-793(-)